MAALATACLAMTGLGPGTASAQGRTTGAAPASKSTEKGSSALSVSSPAPAPAPTPPGQAPRVTEPDASGVFAQLTQQPVRLVSAGRPLGEVQRMLETALGVRLILTAGAAMLPVSGEITGEDGLAFLRELTATLRMEWAIGREGVYLAPEGSSRAVIFNAPSTVVAFRAASLANQEFLEMGSGIRVASRKEEITVTGIPAWINQVAALRVPMLVDFVQRTMAQQAARKAALADAAASSPLVEMSGSQAKGEPLSLMVFRLNNAYVDDKKVTVGSSSVTIQGVASMFRQFTGLGGGGGESPGQAFGGDGGGSRLPRMDPLAGGRSAGRGEREDEATRALQRGGGAGGPAVGPVVIADSRLNALMVRDRASMLEAYKALVKVLDQPTDMVQLDAFVIDIKASRLDEFGLGLSWGGSARLNSPVLSPGGSVPAGANLILQAPRGAQLLAQIRALETTGDSEILTVPSVVTLNNLEASFSARQNFFVKVSGNQDASLTKVTAETLLKVTPLVSQEGAPGAGGGYAPGNGSQKRIRLLISIQDGTVDASTSAVVDNLPRTLENQISTQAVVRGGDTLVIGGQVVRKRVNRVAGLPIIRDIPLLGALTSSRSDDYEQYVRVYVVRPRILGDDSALLNEPVADHQGDPLVHGVVGRVPQLIRGSGLSPQGQDAARPNSVREAVESMSVVPVPQPVQPPAPALSAPPPNERRGSEGRDKTRSSDAPEPAARGDRPDRTDRGAAGPRGGQGSQGPQSTPEEAPNDDWNPDDPIWRPPGSPLGRRLTPGPPASRPSGAGSNPRVDGATKASRDREAKQILEAELRRAEQQVQRLQAEAEDTPAALAALARARGDVAALRQELARMGAPASSTGPMTTPLARSGR